jgi:hypothetical protein
MAKEWKFAIVDEAKGKTKNVSVRIADAIPSAMQLQGIFYHSGHGSGAALYNYDEWKELAVKYRCVEMRIDEIGGNGAARAEEVWKAVLSAAKKTAELSGRAEIEQIPWVLTSHSIQGRTSQWMAYTHPDRVLAILDQHGRGAADCINSIPLNESTPAITVPRLHVFAAIGDEFQNDIMEPLIRKVRLEADGAWSACLRTTADHNDMSDQSYVKIWMDEVLALRIPSNAVAPYKPADIEKEQSWYCDYKMSIGEKTTLTNPHIYSHDEISANRKSYVWLPSKRAAEAWMEYSNEGALTESLPSRIQISQTRHPTIARLKPLDNPRIFFTARGRKIAAGSKNNSQAKWLHLFRDNRNMPCRQFF